MNDPTAADLFLGDRKHEDSRQNNDCSNPKTSGHFVHVAKKNEGHNDAIYRFEVGDQGHSKGRKLPHNRYPGNVGKRSADGAQQQKITNISML